MPSARIAAGPFPRLPLTGLRRCRGDAPARALGASADDADEVLDARVLVVDAPRQADA